jgi:hypothetical protein
LSKALKRFFAIDLSKAIFREITDASVIFSMSFLTYILIAEWGDFRFFETADCQF